MTFAVRLRACWLLSLVIVAGGCAGGVTSPLLRRADEHAAAGRHGQAYADYRGALYYELPPTSDEFAAARPRMDEAFHRWVAELVADASRALAAGDAVRAFVTLAGVADPRFGEMPWETKERKFVAVRPDLRGDERAAIARGLDDALWKLWPVVDQQAGAGRFAAAVAIGAALAAPFSPGHAIHRRLADVRARAAAHHRELARAAGPLAGAAVLHTLLARRFAGGAPEPLPRRNLGWQVTGGGGRCAALARRLEAVLPRSGDVVVTIALSDEQCAVTDRRWTAREPYQYTAYESRYTEPRTDCSGGSYTTQFKCVYDSGTQTQTCGTAAISTPPVCHTTPGYYTEVPVERTGTRDVEHYAVSARWTGTVTLTWEGRTRSLPFSIARDDQDSAWNVPERRSIALTPADVEKAAAADLAAFLDAQTAGIRRDRADAALARASSAMTALARDDAYVEAIQWTGTVPPDAVRWLDDRHGLTAADVDDLLHGRAPQAPSFLTAPPALDLEPRLGCKACLAYRGLPLRERPDNSDGGAGLGYANVRDPELAGDTTHVVTLTSIVHTFPKRAVGYAVTVDLALGVGTGGGILYGLNLLPVGVGVRRGPFAATLTAGGGLGGMLSGRIPFGWQVPVEAFARWKLSPRLHLMGSARVQWVFSADARQDGSASAPFGDELTLWAGLRLGRSSYDAKDNASAFYLGVEYRELLDTRMLGLVLGTSLTN